MKILLVDDHKIVRQGISAILKKIDGIEQIYEASNGREAVDMTFKFRPDLIIMDIQMPLLDGVEASHEIRKSDTDVKILILTMVEEEQYILDALSANINGYLLKMSDLDELITAIKKISQGESYFDSKVTNIIIGSRNSSRTDTSQLLSKREIEILTLIVKGNTSKEIGEMLYISQFTVQKHRKNIIKKLDLHSTAELVKYAIENSII